MKKLNHILGVRRASGVYGLGEMWPTEAVKAMATKRGFSFFYLDGKNICNKSQFLKQIAAVLSFPNYTGHNWDALADSLTDMSWHEAEGYVLVVDNLQAFAQASPADFSVAVDIFRDAAEFWPANDKAWYVLFSGQGVEQQGFPLIES